MTAAETFLLVDDNTLLRASLAKLIGLWRKDAIIAEAHDGRQAVEKARRLRPTVILMDIRMSVCDGIEATRLIKAELPETKVIMLTVSEEEEDLFEAISSGAHGYLNILEKLHLKNRAQIAAYVRMRRMVGWRWKAALGEPVSDTSLMSTLDGAKPSDLVELC